MSECARCLLDDSLPGVSLHADGLCDLCSTPAPDGTEARSFLSRLLRRETARQGQYDAILAFSGGKDSVGALVYLARHRLKVRAVLFNNGFIPASVIDQARRLAEKCATDFEVVTLDLSSEFSASVGSRSFQPAPCTICMREVWRVMDEVAGRYRTELVCSGHRYPPGLKPLAMQHLRWLIAIPVAATLDSQTLHQLRDSVGYEEPSVPGQSSNCLVPRAVEAAYEEWFGFNPGVFELSKEVRSGLVSKTEARAALLRKTALQPDPTALIKLGLRSLLTDGAAEA